MENIENTKLDNTSQLQNETETMDKECLLKLDDSNKKPESKLLPEKFLNERTLTGASSPSTTSVTTDSSIQKSCNVGSISEDHTSKMQQCEDASQLDYKDHEEETTKALSATSKKEEHQHGSNSNNEDREPVSNHEESDYEDNIVVTVPSASDMCTDKYLSRRHGGGGGHPRPPGLDNSPKHKRQVYITIRQIPNLRKLIILFYLV